MSVLLSQSMKTAFPEEEQCRARLARERGRDAHFTADARTGQSGCSMSAVHPLSGTGLCPVDMTNLMCGRVAGPQPPRVI